MCMLYVYACVEPSHAALAPHARYTRYLTLDEARKPKAKEAIQMPSTGNYQAYQVEMCMHTHKHTYLSSTYLAA